MSTQNSIRKKVQDLREMHVDTERDDQMRRHLERLLKVDDAGNLTAEPARFTGGQETHGIAVIEPAGGGKTTAIRNVLKSTEVLGMSPDTGLARYLELQVPSPATLKSVGLAILSATGMSEVSETRSREWEIWSTVRHRLGLLGIVVLWLDEAQDLILAKSAMETEKTLRMLKSLMQGETPVILVLSGTQRLAEMTSFDPQVSRRFSKIVPPDLQFGTDEDKLAGMIDGYCELVGISTRLTNDVPARLILASRRRFGRCVEMIITAIEIALCDGAARLTHEHFAEALALQEGCSPDENVFLAPDWVSIELDKGAEEYEAARTKRQKKKLERI